MSARNLPTQKAVIRENSLGIAKREGMPHIASLLEQERANKKENQPAGHENNYLRYRNKLE